jgi:hypothetical protein
MPAGDSAGQHQKINDPPEYQVGPFCRKGLLFPAPLKNLGHSRIHRTLVPSGRRDLLAGGRHTDQRCALVPGAYYHQIAKHLPLS